MQGHHWRERKTGPGHPLQVVVCRTHRRWFTIYPRAYVPYGRAAVALPGLFDVAVEAAADRWQSDQQDDGRWRQSQARWLLLCGLWLGLGATAVAPEQAAAELGVSLHEHQRLRGVFAGGGYRERAQTVLALCEELGAAPWRRLLRVGYRQGLCGRAFELDRQGCLHARVHGSASFRQRE